MVRKMVVVVIVIVNVMCVDFDNCYGNGNGDGDGYGDGTDVFKDRYDDCVTVIVCDFVDDNNVKLFQSTTGWYRQLGSFSTCIFRMRCNCVFKSCHQRNNFSPKNNKIRRRYVHRYTGIYTLHATYSGTSNVCQTDCVS